MPVRNISKRLSITAFICLSFIPLFAQNINFKHYGIEEGIIHPTIYTISQDKSGFLWLGTGAGVCRFDGVKFSTPHSKDTLSDTYVTTSFCDKNGNAWFGYDDGSIFNFSSRKFKKIYRNNESPSKINAFAENTNGVVIAITQNSGFCFIENNNPKLVSTGTEGKLFYSIANLNDNNYLLGTGDGLYVFNIDVKAGIIRELTKINNIPSTKIQCIIPAKESNSFWIGTEDAGFYNIKSTGNNQYSVTNFGEKLKLGSANVQWILEDKQKNVWICTFGNGLYKLPFNLETGKYADFIVYNQTNGLNDDFIKNAYQDTEGNIWIGSYSNGLWGIIDEAFVFYNFKNDGFGNDIISIASNNESFWLGSRKALIKVDAKNTSQRKLYTEKNGLPADVICALYLTQEGILWIGTEKSGLYRMDTHSGTISKYFSSPNSIENKINSIKEKDGVVWVGTNGGVIKFTLKSGKIDHYSTDTGLPHNRINDVFIDSKGIVWIATKCNGITSVNSEKKYAIDPKNVGGDLEFKAIAEDKYGHLWAATYGDGVFEFKDDKPINLTEQNGLKSDYCYSLVSDVDGNIWVGHRLALSKINVQNNKIITYGSGIGITGDCNQNSANIDPSGTLRFGTTDGLVQYNYQKNRQKLQAPFINMLSIKISDKEIDFTNKVDLPYGIYRMRFDFIGLNYRAPSSVKYQYKLEGWESQWSELTENTFAYYPRVEDGRFTFLVRAYNAEGVCSQEPFKIEVYISAPIWKRWWFITLCVIILAVLLYLYIKYRERKQIQFQQYLQKMLDERTREVVEQKEEIENKNRDITDSITYAQRIQTSILPSIKKLQDTFSGCFIFYQPRDIVSGDFYWFDKITDSKFVIVCGDSTGHGVPGALMSMIGTTLIKDICNRPDVVSPSKILVKLDEEMKETLNQNFEAEKSSDGMDLIACEIDTETYTVKIASAMRPVILYINGEQIYSQGSKSSIGGDEIADENKDFENQVYHLTKGDLIYMFSDGYPDQFGGPMGKKFKMVRLRNLLKDIHQLPMEEQYHHLKNTFNLWRDQYDQVDDVLFMGIRI